MNKEIFIQKLKEEVIPLFEKEMARQEDKYGEGQPFDMLDEDWFNTFDKFISNCSELNIIFKDVQ